MCWIISALFCIIPIVCAVVAIVIEKPSQLVDSLANDF